MGGTGCCGPREHDEGTNIIDKLRSFSYIYYLEKTFLYIMDLSSQQSLKMLLKWEAIPQNYASIQLKKKLLMCGGQFKKVFITTCYEVTETEESFYELKQPQIVQNEKANMQIPKSLHCLCLLNPIWVYSIGGYNTNGELNVCEKYNVLEDAWETVCSMNRKKHSPAVASFNEHFLYVFGGVDNDALEAGKYYYYLNLIESFNTFVPEEGWKVFNLKINQELWVRNSQAAALQVNINEILIFGGRPNNKVGFLFNPENKSVEKIESMHGLIRGANPVIFQNKAYFLGEGDRNGVHVFSLSKKQWKYIESKK